MIRPLVLAVALLLGVVGPPGRAAAAASPAEGARVEKERGDLHKKAGDLPAAEQAYRRAVAADAGYAQAHEALGSALYAQKRFDEAIRSFSTAVEVDPTLANAWYNLAFAQRRVGDLRKARGSYERYLALRPADPDGHYGLAETLRGLKERDAAVAEYRRFIELASATPAQAPWVEKARAAIAELDPSEPRAAPPSPSAAVAAPTMAAAAVPAPTPAPTSLPPPAPASVPVSAPVSVAAVATVAAPEPAAASIGPAPAQALAQPPAALPPPAPPSRALTEKLGAGDRAYLAGDYRTALFAYQDAAYLDPTNPTARIKLARAYVALRYPAQAETQLKQVLDLDPGNEEARRLLEELKHPPATPTPANGGAGPGPKPGSASTPRVYKLTEDAAGIGAAAMIAARPAPVEPPVAAPAAPPTAPPAAPAPDAAAAAQHYRAGLALIASRDYKGAIIELDQAIDANPSLGAAWSARASAYFGLARYADASRDYEAAIGLAPNLATPLYGLAECYRRLNDPRAAEYYQRYADSGATDVREELRVAARKRVAELGGR